MNARANISGSRYNSVVQIATFWSDKKLLSENETLEQVLSEFTELVFQSHYKRPKNIVKRENFNVNGRKYPAETLSLEITPNNILRVKYVILEHEDKILLFSATYEPKHEDEWTAVIQEILSSWKLSEPNAKAASITSITDNAKSQDIYKNNWLSDLSFIILICIGLLNSALKSLIWAIPAFILRFVFKKKYKIWQACLWGLLFTILPVFINPNGKNFDSGLTMIFTIALLSKSKKEIADEKLYKLSNDDFVPIKDNQTILDDFWARPKNFDESNKLYKQYIAYLHEKGGCSIEYLNLNNLIDMIAYKGGKTGLIKCEFCDEDKLIDENTIFQFFGAASKYKLQHKDEKVYSSFFTPAALSQESQAAAKEFKIKIYEKLKLPERFPVIKCKADNDARYYYLPDDEPYYKIKINLNNGDAYCQKIEEAEKLGFSRA